MTIPIQLAIQGGGAKITLAARRVGGAVDRNRARRILREAWRQVSSQVTGDLDAVLVAREGIRGATTQDLVSEMIDLLPRGAEHDDDP